MGILTIGKQHVEGASAMKKLVAAVSVFVTVAACAGCSSSAPTPTPGPAPAPAQNEKQLSEEDLDGDGKADAVLAVPTRPELTTFSSIRVVAGSGQTLLSLTNAEGDLDGVVIAPVPGAPAPVLVVNRAGPTRDELMTPYLYDKAAQKMVALQWARKDKQTSVLQGKVEVSQNGRFIVWEHYWDGTGWQSQEWSYRDGNLTPSFEP
jgi:hypothetical protein